MALNTANSKIISAEKVSLNFPVFRKTSLRAIFAKPKMNDDKSALVQLNQVLNNIHFDLKMGDRLALIGENGAGKSTLLRLLGGVYKPSSGSLICNDVPACLFDLNIGFDMEADGYTNIPIAAAQLGYSRGVTTALIEHVIHFSELGERLRLPVKAMSSGMQMRLAFSISTFRKSSIFLIDEIVGVGDTYFVEKAAKYLKSQIGNSGVLVLASHADSVVRDFCNIGMVMNKGCSIYVGPVEKALDIYYKSIKK